MMFFLNEFLFLKDELEKNIIPQVPLFDLLKKFDGLAEKVSVYIYIL